MIDQKLKSQLGDIDSIDHYLGLVEGAIQGIKNHDLRELVYRDFESRKGHVRDMVDVMPMIQKLLQIGKRHSKSNPERLQRFQDIHDTFMTLEKFNPEVKSIKS